MHQINHQFNADMNNQTDKSGLSNNQKWQLRITLAEHIGNYDNYGLTQEDLDRIRGLGKSSCPDGNK